MSGCYCEVMAANGPDSTPCLQNDQAQFECCIALMFLYLLQQCCFAQCYGPALILLWNLNQFYIVIMQDDRVTDDRGPLTKDKEVAFYQTLKVCQKKGHWASSLNAYFRQNTILFLVRPYTTVKGEERFDMHILVMTDTDHTEMKTSRSCNYFRCEGLKMHYYIIFRRVADQKLKCFSWPQIEPNTGCISLTYLGSLQSADLITILPEQ